MIRPDLPNITRSRKSLARWVVALVAGFVAALAAFAIAAPPGPGLDPDAASYLGAAQSLARGDGYRIPIADWRSPDTTGALTHFPPGYPTLIALPIVAGAAPDQAARVVNAVAAFVDFAVIAWLVTWVAGAVAALCLTAAVLVMHPVVVVHMSVLSEPLFLACTSCVLLAMVGLAAADNPRLRAISAWTAGAMSAAAMLVRYVGASVCAAVLLWIWIQPIPIATRMRRSMAVVIPWLFLVGAWMLNVHLTSGVSTIRALGAYGGFAETLRMGFDTVVDSLIPLSADQTLPGRSWFALALLALLGAIGIAGARRARESVAGTAIAAAATLALCYLVMLVASRLLADPNIPFDERLLVPIFVLLAVAFAVANCSWWQYAARVARIGCGVVLIAWFGASYHASSDEVDYALEYGQDFAQQQWKSSPLLSWARANASRRILYSNWAAAVVFHLHRAAHELPNEPNDAVLRAFADTVRARNGVVLVFDQTNPDQIVAQALLRIPGIRQVARVADGVVFAAP